MCRSTAPEEVTLQGFAILCGLMFGKNNNGAHAFNWTIEPSNTAQIVFIEFVTFFILPSGVQLTTSTDPKASDFRCGTA